MFTYCLIIIIFFPNALLSRFLSDNRTNSDVTLTSGWFRFFYVLLILFYCCFCLEYDLLQREFHFTVEEIVRMLDYGFHNAFLVYCEFSFTC